MAKTKNKRKLADKVRSKKSASDTKVNPFEIKVNRLKHDVLGKKTAKHDRGMPGVTRFKAIKKRKETLLVEYKKRGKVNKFVDRRFGETDPEISLEDKMLQRFALERKRTTERSNVFSLNEEDGLTHYGQSLSEIEKYDEPAESDEDEEEGRLGADLVAEEHFGGFLTKKGSALDEDGQRRTWKERMEEIIAKSKKKKFERQSEKDKANHLTEELDLQWKTLMHVMSESKRNKNKDDSAQPTKKVDDYDKMVRELQFEIRGQATDRLKTEEELAKEEMERLEKLETDRLRRMKGITPEDEQQEKSAYRSADDLDDGFDLGGKNVQFEVAYDDGKLLGIEEMEGGEKNSKEREIVTEEEEDGESDESEEDEDSDDAMEHLSDLESSGEEAGSEEEGSEEESEGEDSELKDVTQAQPTKPKTKPVALLKSSLKKVKLNQAQIEEQLQKKKKVMEAAKKELPYTFKAPESYTDLLALLQGHGDRDQIILIDRLQKLYHPSLAEGNKDKLQTLYSLLVEYYCDLALQDPPLLALLDSLVKPLYQLTQRYPTHSAATWSQLMASKQQEFSELAASKGGRGMYPGLDMLLSFKLLSRLYPTSDYKHPVITPAMLYMTQVLAQCPVLTYCDVASGLLLCSVCLEYVSFAKRLVPEVLNFLRGLLFTVVEKQPDKVEPVCPPFKPVGKNINLLKLDKKCKTTKIGAFKFSQVFSSKGSKYLQSDDFKVICVYHCMKLVSEYMNIYQHLPSYKEIFSPIMYFVEKLPLKRYPSEIKVLHEEVLAKFNSPEGGTSRKPLTMPKERPKPLKMFEPKFEEVFDGRKKRVGSRETQEKQRLVHKYKREMKGAVRSLRQDNSFLAREKLNEQIERDAERKRKVNQLFQDLASQEGDYKAMKRAKDKV